MSTADQPRLEPLPRHIPAWMQVLPDPADLIGTDGEPLETNWHRLAMSLLLEVVAYHWRARKDFFAGGNMFIYFSKEQARNKDYRGPDFFFVWDVDGTKDRDYWAIWDENYCLPNVIIELASHTTIRTDRTVKKEIYEKTFKTPEYFIYNPETKKLEGWRLNVAGVYEEIPTNERGWLWCEQFQLWLGLWDGHYLEVPGLFLRFYDENGNLVPIGREAEKQRADLEKHRADQKQLLAEQEKRRAEQERFGHEQEKLRAEQEKQRADAAEAKLAELKAKLAELESKNKPAL